MGRKKRKKFLILSVVVLVAAAVAVVWYWPAWRRWEAERLLAKYRAAPDVATATKLMERLHSGEVDEELGGRILGAIFNRVAAVRKSYRPDVPIRFAMETTNPIPKDLALLPGWHETFATQELIALDPWNRRVDELGADFSGFEMAAFCPREDGFCDWITDSLLYFWGGSSVPERTHRFTAIWRVCYTENVPSPSTQPSLLSLKTRRPRKAKEYKARITVPVEIRVVPKDKAASVLVRSDPALDEAIRAGIRVVPHPLGERQTSWSSLSLGGSGTAQVAGGFILEAEGLPMGCVFRVRYVDSGSAIDGVDGGVLLLRPGVRSRIPFPQVSGKPQATRFDGKLVLTPDRVAAAGYPGFESIWGGKLELPLRFEVSNLRAYFTVREAGPARKSLYWPDGRPKPYPIGPLIGPLE